MFYCYRLSDYRFVRPLPLVIGSACADVMTHNCANTNLMEVSQPGCVRPCSHGVSVIIPNYNHAGYLPDRFTSVLSQTLPAFEIVVLDDASTDGSRAIAEQFAAEQACVLVPNTENSGSAFKQWRRGIERARGKYVWIAESDDRADPRFLAEMVKLLEADPTRVLAYSASEVIDEAGRPHGPATGTLLRADPRRWERDYTDCGQTEIRNYLLFENTIPNASAVVFRRDAYDAVGGVDESMRLCGDWKLWCALLAKGDVAYRAEPLNQFRRHEATARRRTSVAAGFVEAVGTMTYAAGLVDLTSAEAQRLRGRFWTLLLAALTVNRPSPGEVKQILAAARSLPLGLGCTGLAELAAGIGRGVSRRLRSGAA